METATVVDNSGDILSYQEDGFLKLCGGVGPAI